MIPFWNMLVPLTLYANTLGTFNIQFKVNGTDNTKYYQNVYLKSETKYLLEQDTDCRQPLFVFVKSDTLYACCVIQVKTSEYEFEVTPSRCRPPGYHHALLRVGGAALYNIDTTLLSYSYLRQQLTNCDSLLLAYDYVTRVVYYARGEGDKEVTQIKEFLLPDTLTHRRKPLQDEGELKKIIKKVYAKDCCSTPSADCIPFKYLVSGCEDRALKVIEYLDTIPYSYYMVIAKGRNETEVYPIYAHLRHIRKNQDWQYHVAAALLYQNDTVVLDPSLMVFTDREWQAAMANPVDSFSIESWQGKFIVPPGCDSATTLPKFAVCIQSGNDFLCDGIGIQKPVTGVNSQLGTQHEEVKASGLCFCFEVFERYKFARK